MHLEPDAMSYNAVLNACAMTGQISSPLVQLENRFFILATLRAWGIGPLQGAEGLLEEMLSFHLESQQQ